MTVVTLKNSKNQFNPRDNSSVSEENQDRLTEINRLADEIVKSKAELRLLAIELKQIERDINKFLDEYYGSVSEFVDQESGEASSDNLISISNGLSDQFSHAESNHDLVRRLYKKLSKMCHPDVQANDALNKYFISINDAYSDKNLKELIRIEEYLSGDGEMEGESPKEKLERLSLIYDEVLDKIKAMKYSKQVLLDSPEYELRSQVLWAKMCGEDLINKIRDDLSKQFYNIHAEA